VKGEKPRRGEQQTWNVEGCALCFIAYVTGSRHQTSIVATDTFRANHKNLMSDYQWIIHPF
jgi:hypothetical protein